MNNNEVLWHQVANDHRLIGGDMTAYESGSIFRGPIKSVTIEGEFVNFETEWTAVSKDGGQNWKKGGVNTAFTEIAGTKPTILGDGTVSFFIQYIGPITLSPKGNNDLDPKLVKGLQG